MTSHPAAYACLALFAVTYLLVMLEEPLDLRKSKPVMVAAGLMWVVIAFAFDAAGQPEVAGHAIREYLLEFGELFLFLLAAMTFVNTMENRHVFRALRSWLVARRLSLRSLFWVTGLLAFFISPVADNMTTALVMGAVVLAVGAGRPRFLAVGCINLVVAANAGGAWSPFGDITTLMVWQAGKLGFWEFMALFLPAVMNWVVPAFFMSFAVEEGRPIVRDERVPLRPGAIPVIALFLATLALSVFMHARLHLPPVLGMMTGLGVLKLYGSFLRKKGGGGRSEPEPGEELAGGLEPNGGSHLPEGTRVVPVDPQEYFDIFRILERAEWDTLLFFYGVILCVGGLGTLGWLALASQLSYGALGPTAANVLIGLLSSVVDNIPLMVAVLQMNPAMPDGQWLLVTLTAGVGGSLLSIGSAAGVALMGQARGSYTFLTHLRWTWAVGLGYAASIAVHLVVNRHLL